jgi:hypothetical protein
MKNTDSLAPWHREPFVNDPISPHCKDPDNPDKAWNKIFWHPMDLTQEERQYYKIDYDYYNWKEQWKQKQRERLTRKFST